MMTANSLQSQNVQVVGRYVLYDPIAAGGMATVHLARLLGPVGFSRTVAIKRLHPQFATDPEFVSMFLDEARVAARIRHPNVVQTLDVVAQDGGLFLVMDYIQGESLARLVRVARNRNERVPPRIVGTIMAGALQGLHAAHQATGERGELLGLVHRDVSPQNVMVGTDGVARVLDFGVAKAIGRVQQTQSGQIKGKLAYMAPEQLRGVTSFSTDIYAASIVLWEALTGERMFSGDDAALLARLLDRHLEPPSKFVPGLSKEVDAVVMRGLEADPSKRYPSAREMARAVERVIGTAPPSEVGEWVEAMAKDTLADRMRRVAEIESVSSDDIRVGLLAKMSSNGDATQSAAIAKILEHTGTTDPKASGAILEGVDLSFDSIEPPERTKLSSSLDQRWWTPANLANRKRDIALVITVTALAIVSFVIARPAFQSQPTQVVSTGQSPDRGHGVAGGQVATAPSGIAAAPPTGDSLPGPIATEAPPTTVSATPHVVAPRNYVRVVRPAPPPPPVAPPPPPAVDTAKTKVSAKPDCVVPFTLDTNGIRHPRPECL